MLGKRKNLNFPKMDIGFGHANPREGTAMALFKELTDADGDRIIVNVDAVRFMQRITDTTRIYFGNDDAVKVKETPDEILMLRAL